MCNRLTRFLACFLITGCDCLIAVYRRLKGVFEKGSKVIPFQGVDIVIFYSNFIVP